jgi:PAS domain S-box-containing protein
MNYSKSTKGELIASLQQLQKEFDLQKKSFTEELSRQQQIETDLVQSEERLRYAIEGATDGLWDWDIVTNKVYYSKQWKSIMGYEEWDTPDSFDDWRVKVHADYVENALQLVGHHLKGLTPSYRYEYMLVGKNGQFTWVLDEGKVVTRNENGNPLRVIGTLKDISARKYAENALQLAENKYNRLVESVEEVVFEITENGTLTFMNEAIEKLSGYTPAELIGENILSFIHEDDRERLIERISTGSAKQFYTFECRYKIKNGTFLWFHISSFALTDAAGSYTGRRGTLVDITARKNNEAALIESEANLNYAQELAQMGSWENNLINNKITFSNGLYKLYGMQPSEKEITLDDILSKVHPDDMPLLKNNIQSIATNKLPNSNQFRYIMPDGSIKWILYNIVPVFDGDNLIKLKGTNLDITGQKLHEAKITQQKERLTAIVAAMPDFLFILDKNGTYLEMYSPRPNMLPLPDREIIGANVEKIFDAATANTHLQNIAACIDGQKLMSYEVSLGIGYYEVRMAPLGTDKVLCFIRDITEIKLKDDVLKKLLLAVEQSPVSIKITDAKGIIEYINPALIAATGYSEAELIGKPANIMKSGKMDNAIYEGLTKTILAGNIWQGEMLNRKRDGSLFLEYLSINPIKNNKGEITNYLAIKQDISERKNAEEILKQSEEKYRNMFVNNPQPIYIYEMETLSFLDINDAAIAFYGYSRAEFLTLNLKDIRPKADVEALLKHISENNIAKSNASEWRHIKKNGEIMDVEVITYPINYHNQPAMQALINDITKKKKTEREITELYANLELRIEQRSSQLATINTDLRKEIDDRKLLEKALNASRHSYKNVVENVNEVIFQTDAAGLWLFLNKSWETITGFTVEESIGQLFVNYVYPDDRQRNMEQFAPLINREKEYCRHQIRYLTKDGGFRWIEVFAKLGENELGEIEGTYGTLQDITEKKMIEIALQMKSKEQENFFNVTLDLLSISDAQGKFLKVNKEWSNFLGFSTHEIEQKSMLDFVHPADMQSTIDTLAQLNERQPILNFTNRYLSKEGDYRFVEWRSVPVGDLYYSSARDITFHINAESTINTAKLEAEEANKAKSEFLSRMSHEFRTPMNSILGFAQLLEMGDLNTGQKRGVKHILNSGNHLLDLINEVLDISRIEAGHIQLLLEPVQVAEMLHEIMGIIYPLAQKQQINVVLQSSPFNQLSINADRQRLKQVLLNLLGNAIKYNRQNGSVNISVQTMPLQENGVENIRISFTDTGLGIAEKDILKLFTPFERIGADKTAIEGTGLGLVVVKKLMEAMDGQLGVTSKLGEGSTFWIELPQVENVLKFGQKPLELNETMAATSGTILYIEDNAANLELVEVILSKHRPGIKLISSMYGKQTLSLAVQYAPDLILLDLNLPDIHGSEVIDILKGNEIAMSIPVVVVSADALPQQLQHLLKAGAKSYITKPINVISFLHLIDEFIAYQQS